MKLSTVVHLFNRKWKIAAWIVLWIVVGVPWSYYDWPIEETKYVKVLGTRDKKQPDAQGGGDQRRVQTYIVQSDCSIDEDGEPYILKNENDWWWFKKNAEILQGKMKLWSIEVKGNVQDAPYVKIGHDGWSIKWIDLYPNLLSAERLDGCPYED